MEDNLSEQIKSICDRYKIVPNLLSTPEIKLGNWDFEKNTVDVFFNIKQAESHRITKEMHDAGILPQNLAIEII